MDDQPTAGPPPQRSDAMTGPDATGGAVHPASPPATLGVVRIALLVNAVLLTLQAVMAYRASVVEFSDPARALGTATFTELFAVLSVVLALRLSGGRRSTRTWTNVLATLTLLLPGLGRAGLGEASGLLVALVSIAVLILVNTSEVRRFFRRPAGDRREARAAHAD